MARPAGGLPEIIRDGVDGFLATDPAALAARVADVAGLDRVAICASVLARFSAARMVDAYLALYERLTGAL